MAAWVGAAGCLLMPPRSSRGPTRASGSAGEDGCEASGEPHCRSDPTRRESVPRPPPKPSDTAGCVEGVCREPCACCVTPHPPLTPRTLPHAHDQHHRYRQKIHSTRPRPLNGRHQHNGARPTLAPRPYHVPARMRALLASHGGRGGGGGSSSTNDERCCAECSATPAIAEVIGCSTLAVFISVRPASWSSSPSRALPR